MKRFTVIGLLAAMLVLGASFAQAADVPPSALSNQSWAVVGMGFSGNVTAGVSSAVPYKYVVYNSTTLHTPFGAFFFNASASNNVLRMNGTLGAYNGSSIGTLNFFQEDYVLNNMGPKKGVPGLIRAEANFTNGTVFGFGTSPDYLYIFAAPDYSLMVGIANVTAGNWSKSGGAKSRNGTSLLAMVQRNPAATVSAASKGLGGTWSLFSLQMDKDNKTAYRAGELTIASTGPGATWKGYDSKQAVSNASVSYNVDTDGRLFRVVNSSSISKPGAVIVNNATMDAYNKTFIGFEYSGDNPSMTVATKGGVIGDASDFQNVYLKLVAAGTGKASASAAAGNGTATLMQMYLDGNAKVDGAGNMTTLNAGPLARGGHTSTASIDGYTLNLGTRTIGGVQFRNFTILNSTGSGTGIEVFGRWNAEKTYFVGIWNKSGDSYQLAFAFPTASASSNFTKATNTAAYWDNATLANTFTVNSGYNGEKTVQASTLISDYSLDSSFTPVTGVKYFNASSTVSPSAKNTIYFTGTYDISGIGGKLNTYRLYKLVNKTSTLSNRVFNQKSVRSPAVDGAWWLEQSGTVLDSGSTLDPSVTYSLYFVIKDGGDYDLSKTSTTTVQIQDPQVLGTITPTSSSSSSSSSGCVFNPAAGFGLEWLLLLLAPAIGIIRSRFKK
ncbi:MAG: hypothetical protein PWQ57_1467 [Desulfovibrionales bacterium]|nr:hypothetical protein [Desulfovibrionales bacterium]